MPPPNQPNPRRDELNGGAKLAIERLKYRTELRSAGDPEDTGVIESEALKRSVKPKSDPPQHGPFAWVVAPVVVLVKSVDPKQRLWAVLLLFVLVAMLLAMWQGWIRVG
jgi:hypothetical protein